MTNGWYLHFHKMCHRQNWTAGTSRENNSLEIYQATDFRKTLPLPLNKGYGNQMETAGVAKRHQLSSGYFEG